MTLAILGAGPAGVDHAPSGPRLSDLQSAGSKMISHCSTIGVQRTKNVVTFGRQGVFGQ